MAVLSPGDLFANTIPVECGGDTLELHNPTVEEVADIRAGLVAKIQAVCTHPYDDALSFDGDDDEGRSPKYPEIYDYIDKEVVPAMMAIMWREYGMPADDRAYRAARARMSVEQLATLPQTYIESVGMDAVFEMARNSGDAAGNT